MIELIDEFEYEHGFVININISMKKRNTNETNEKKE